MRARALAAVLAAVGVGTALGAAPAVAAQPPRLGSVTCGADGAVAFARNFDFAPGRKPNGQLKPDLDSRIGFKHDPTGCSGSQSGGNPKRPGAISRGRFMATGFSTGHTCAGLSAHGVRDVKVTATWFDTNGANLGVTKIAGASVSVSGLGNGVPSDFPPPNNPSPGIVTFTLSGTADPTSSAFPGEPVHATFVADRTTDQFPLPCSTTSPPLPERLDGFTFSGVNGPSTISIP